MMSLARRSMAVVASAAAMTFLMTGGFPLGAQESSAAKSQTTRSKQANAPASTDSSTAKSTGKTAPPDVTHRVPAGYSKLGLTDQQKEKLYKIQAEYYPKIQALEKQVTSLREKREKEFESVLTAPQKRLLAEAEQQKKAAAEAKKAQPLTSRLPPRRRRGIEDDATSLPKRAAGSTVRIDPPASFLRPRLSLVFHPGSAGSFRDGSASAERSSGVLRRHAAGVAISHRQPPRRCGRWRAFRRRQICGSR